MDILYIYIHYIYIYIYVYIYNIYTRMYMYGMGYVWIEWNVWNICIPFWNNGRLPRPATNGKNMENHSFKREGIPFPDKPVWEKYG